MKPSRRRARMSKFAPAQGVAWHRLTVVRPSNLGYLAISRRTCWLLLLTLAAFFAVTWRSAAGAQARKGKRLELLADLSVRFTGCEEDQPLSRFQELATT